MPRAAVVNPRRRRRAAPRRRRRNPSLSSPPKRRRRRYYGAASRRRNPRRRRSGGKRRRNPSTYGYMVPRQQNPDVFDIDQLMDIVPSATGGIFAVRFGMKLAGDFEEQTVKNAQGMDVKVAVPGVKHAIAGLFAAKYGAGIVANITGGGPEKEKAALYAGLGFVGDVFARLRLLQDNKWVAENLMLQGIDDCSVSGLQESSQLGDGDGLPDGEYFQDEEGNIYQLPAGSDMSGLQESSQLGASPRAMSGGGSTFGY